MISRRIKAIVTSFAFLCLLTISVNAFASEKQELVAVGDTLKPFMLQQFGEVGKYIALRDYCGKPRENRIAKERKPVVLSFFANWCQPCKKEIPVLDKLAIEWGDAIQVFLVSVGDSPEEITNWKKEIDVNLPILMDRYKSTSIDRYGVTSLPTVIVVKPDGVIHYVATGYHEGDSEKLDNIVKELL